MAVNIVQLRGQLYRNIRRPLEIDRRPIRYPKSARHLNRQQSPVPNPRPCSSAILPIIFRNNRPPPSSWWRSGENNGPRQTLARGTEKAHGRISRARRGDSTIPACISVASSFPIAKRPVSPGVSRVFRPREISLLPDSPGLIERRASVLPCFLFQREQSTLLLWYSPVGTVPVLYVCTNVCTCALTVSVTRVASLRTPRIRDKALTFMTLRLCLPLILLFVARFKTFQMRF